MFPGALIKRWNSDFAMPRPIVETVRIVAPPNRGSTNSAHIFGTHVPVEEPSTASLPKITGDQADLSISVWPLSDRTYASSGTVRTAWYQVYDLKIKLHALLRCAPRRPHAKIKPISMVNQAPGKAVSAPISH